MTASFKKLMREQVQATLDGFAKLEKTIAPKNGWIKTIREALGISSTVLSKRLNFSRTNLIKIEQREQKGTLTLKTLREVAEALDCQLVYCLVPKKPLDKIIEDQAKKLARKRIAIINHSMKLEQQGLLKEQLHQQEEDLIQELLQGNPKKLWVDQ